MECFSPLLGEILRPMCGSMCSRVVNATRFKSNVQALKKVLESLNEIKGKINDDHKDKSFCLQLMRWQRNSDEVITKAKLKLEERVPCGMSLKSRLSRKLVTILNEARILEKEGLDLLDMIAVTTTQRVEHVPGVSVLHQTTASNMLDKIRDALRSSEVQKIGIWGMSGVGKTTLVRTLNNKLQKEAATQPFGLVIFATVSKDFDPRTFQKQIAERLGIESKMEETVEELARRIYVRLEKETTFLLILDDVWKDIDLDFLGIPRTEDKKGSKIILTSRFQEVFRSLRTDLDVRVDCLCEEEAWELFCQTAGEVARSELIGPIAKKVLLECGGLPLAIITVGTAMRGKTNAGLWVHALTQLSRSVPWIRSIEERIYQPLKLSYDFLEGHAKSCFLLCALFPEDYSIEVAELVMYCIAEGFLEEQGSHEESMNEGITIVESLKDYCLLEDGSRSETVKMHDVVRDFAIWTMSSSQDDDCHSLVLSGKALQDIRQKEFASSLRRVSLMHNNLERLPGLSEKYCMEASTLLLQENYLLQEASEGFLQAFPALRILNLSGTSVNSLPHSGLQLSKLHSLFLRGCAYLTQLPSLETLAKLELLDLRGSGIKEFPKGLEKLESFKHLDLSGTVHLKTIPARIVSLLSSLETLNMKLSNYHWSVEGEEEEGQATLEEIACLDCLQVLSISLICSPSFLTKSNSWIKRLKEFQINVGFSYVLPMRHDKRTLAISDLNLSQVSMEWLLACTTSVALNTCQGLQGMMKKLVTGSTTFVNLKSLTIVKASISSSGGIEKATTESPKGSSTSPDTLPFLEELCLAGVNLVSLSELQAQLGLRLVALKLLVVSMCNNLKTLIEIDMFTMPNLEEIEISFCDSLHNLRQTINGAQKPLLPKLRVMKLRNLPELESVCYEKETWDCLEQVKIMNCGRLYTLPISSKTCGRIKEIKGTVSWWRHLRWDDPSTLETLDPCFKPLKLLAGEVAPIFGEHYMWDS